MTETAHNPEVQIGSPSPVWTYKFNLSSSARVELGCDEQSVSIGERNCQLSEPLEVVHPDDEMQVLIEATTLEND